MCPVAATVVDMLGTFLIEYIRREGVIAPGPLAAGLRSPQCHPIKTSVSPWSIWRSGALSAPPGFPVSLRFVRPPDAVARARQLFC